MIRESGHFHARLPRRVRADAPLRSTRRRLIVAAAAWPVLAWARVALAQSKPPILIGWLDTASRESGAHGLAALKEGLAAVGLKEGSQVVIEERWADGQLDRLPSLAKELAAKRPALIATGSGRATIAAAKAAPGIPIVQASGPSPVAVGLAKSLARPGGMVTGLSNISTDVSEKYLELLLAAVPSLKRIGFLLDSTSSNYSTHVKTVRRGSEHFRIDARLADTAKAEELEPAISRLAKEGAQGLVVMPSSRLSAERARIIKLASAQRWPIIAGPLSFVQAGGLLSYGVDPAENYRRAAYYVDRILKGAKPSDLPIEQPTKFELVLNMKTAKALKLEIPRDLAVRVDRVIE